MSIWRSHESCLHFTEKLVKSRPWSMSAVDGDTQGYLAAQMCSWWVCEQYTVSPWTLHLNVPQTLLVGVCTLTVTVASKSFSYVLMANLSTVCGIMSEFTHSVLVLRLIWKWIGRGGKSFKLLNLALNWSMGLIRC